MANAITERAGLVMRRSSFAMPQNAGAAEPRLGAVDHGAHALARLLGRAVERPRARAPRAPPRRRADGGSTARAAPPVSSRSGAISAALATRGSGSVSVPVLSKTTVSVSASRSIASPALRITPRAEQRAGGDHLHGGDRQRQRARAGDDQHRDRGDDGVVQRRAGGEPADRGQRRGRVHHRRIEARRAVGEPHVARVSPRPPCRAAARPRRSACRLPAAVTRMVSAPEKFTLPA